MKDIDKAKSYATRDNLFTALANLYLMQYHPLVVCTTNGRWTAVFGVSHAPQGDITYAARHGFITIG